MHKVTQPPKSSRAQMSTVSRTGPGYPEGYQLATGSENDGLVNIRAWTGFPKWGFVIFRGIYDNDVHWNTFIALLKESVAIGLRFAKLEEEVGPDLEWTIIEDRANLEGASKDTVRARFLEWVAARSVERDGVLGDVSWVGEHIPRFKYCIFVDDVCLNSIGSRRAFRTTKYRLSGGSLILINGMHSPSDGKHDDDNDDDDDDDETGDSEDDESDGGWEPVEGNTMYDVGWAYIDAIELKSIYGALCYGGGDRALWDSVYRSRRPDRPLEPLEGEPLSAVDEVWVHGSP